MNERRKIQKMLIFALMVALDVVLSPLFRIEGMAPMSSVMNIIAATVMGPSATIAMAVVCGVIRMTLMGIPPLALTGAVFGAAGASLGYQMVKKKQGAMVGEILGTGFVGSLLSYPVMVWFTGQANQLYWLVYTPRFVGATLIGSAIAVLILGKCENTQVFRQARMAFSRVGGI